MKISLNWIKDFINIPETLSPQELSRLFTLHTAEVEGFENQAETFEKIVVGQILEIHPHPNADKLKITKTTVGTAHHGELQIICGANNIYEGQYVAVALPGARVRWHGEGDLIELQPAKIRGVESYGMICASEEIGIQDQSQPSGGILDLSPLKPTAGESIAKVLEKDDVILTIDNKSLTHRPDLWGHYGIAREMAAITQQQLKPFSTKIDLPATGETLHVEVKAKKLCTRYMALKMENIKVEPSPPWLQKRLKAIGHRPINNIVDITNYVMLELGQPLHAFDAQKIVEGIVIRTSQKKEEMTTLDGVTRQLPPETLVIADHQKALAIAGVMGGANSEISPETSSIIIESATFHPSSVRKTSVNLGLRTEAVQRFEKSLDPRLAEQALHRTVELILQICPEAKISGPAADIKNWKEKTLTVTLDLKKVYSKIGKTLSLDEVKRILTSLEFRIEQKSTTKLKVTIPSFRATKDVDMEDDLVEEIARMHGYEHIQPNIPELPIKLPLENHERKLKHQARQILSWGLGYDEVYNYSFYSLKDIQNSLIPEELHVKIQNYLSEDQTHLRVSLVPNILKNIVHNLKYFDECKLYEVGRTYQDLQEYFPLEEKKICGVIVKKITKSAANKNVGNDIFLEAKGDLEKFLEQMRISCFTMEKGQTICRYAHPNRYAEYVVPETCFNKEHPVPQTLQNTYVDGKLTFASVFELHPLVAKQYDLHNVRIALFEINFSRLAQIPRQEIKYRPLPKFPAIEIDISVVIDEKAEIGSLQKMIKETDKTLIQEVILFDLYQGPNIPAGKKALAFKVKLQAADRTLTDEEMKTVQQNIFKQLLEVGGEIRGLN